LHRNASPIHVTHTVFCFAKMRSHVGDSLMAALLSFDRRSIRSCQLSNQFPFPFPFPFLGHIPSRVMIYHWRALPDPQVFLAPGTTLTATDHFVVGCSETATPFSDTNIFSLLACSKEYWVVVASIAHGLQ
jgi:hypothetical protein